MPILYENHLIHSHSEYSRFLQYLLKFNIISNDIKSTKINYTILFTCDVIIILYECNS